MAGRIRMSDSGKADAARAEAVAALSGAGGARAGILTSSHSYKPFRYPWAYDFWKRQQQIHWMPEEVPLGEDCKDWAAKLNDSERALLTQIFRFFTQSDVEVNDNYMERYSRVFRPTEIKMMLASFANMETIHIAAYALLLETIGMPETEFSAFMEYEAMKDKHDYMQTFVKMEDAFIDLAFEAGDIQGMTPDDIKSYIRFIADWRLRQLQLPEVYGVKENPLPWLQAMLSGIEHANFFEARSTEYSKAATKGQWPGDSGVWSDF